jgi:hypothetical protein
MNFSIDVNVDTLTDGLLSILSDDSISAINRSVSKGLENKMKYRIHVRGLNADNISLGSLRLYNADYALKKGVSRGAVNFRVNGSLQNAWVSRKGPGNSYVFEFNSDRYDEIATGLESRRPNVWAISDEEADYVLDRFSEELAKLIG